ncbi:WD40-repeat-containing domain protein [Lentinula raphanica]|nr:WD40-repeat-containing domain protein [Lentinula raphanica]
MASTYSMWKLENMTDLHYKCYTAFESLRGAVASLAISPDGKYIAVAGVFGAAVWDLESLTLPGARNTDKRLFSTSTWLCFDNGSGKTSRYVLILGSLNGDITALDLNEEEMELQDKCLPIAPSSAHQVVSLDVQQPKVGNRSHARVVASFADAIVKCWTLSVDGDFQLVFSMSLETSFLPKTVCFDKEGLHVSVFSEKGGIRALLDCSTGDVISRIENGCQTMAWVSVDQATSRFVASTGSGFQLFDSNNLNHIRSFAHDMDPGNTFPCQITFGENGSKIVGGTSRGETLLFDSDSGLLEQRMEFPTNKPMAISAVTACTLKDRYYIAVAGTKSASGDPSVVMVWCKLRTHPVHQSWVSKQ